MGKVNSKSVQQFKIFQENTDALLMIAQNIFDNSMAFFSSNKRIIYTEADFTKRLTECFDIIDELLDFDNYSNIKDLEPFAGFSYNIMESSISKFQEIIKFGSINFQKLGSISDENSYSWKLLELINKSNCIIDKIINKSNESESYTLLNEEARSLAINIFNEENLKKYLYLVEKYKPGNKTIVKFKNLHYYFSAKSLFKDHSKKLYAKLVFAQYGVNIIGKNGTFTSKSSLKVGEEKETINDLLEKSLL